MKANFDFNETVGKILDLINWVKTVGICLIIYCCSFVNQDSITEDYYQHLVSDDVSRFANLFYRVGVKADCPGSCDKISELT